MLECVVNVSEGRRPAVIAGLASAAGPALLDVHTDGDHHRSVLTLAGPDETVERAVRALATAVVATVDLRAHAGAHPRIGALDVVPFVALAPDPKAGGRLAGGRLADGPPAAALHARDRFARWAATALDLPCFLYGPERTLPELRRTAWREIGPDTGPGGPHPTAGACAVGARPVLVAYNLWLADPDVDRARRIAAAIRTPHLRTLGLAVGDRAQVSCNLVDPWRTGPAAAFDTVTAHAPVERAELVGLLPGAVLDATPPGRWAELDLDPATTIEARLGRAGLDGGRFA